MNELKTKEEKPRAYLVMRIQVDRETIGRGIINDFNRNIKDYLDEVYKHGKRFFIYITDENLDEKVGIK